MVTELASIDMDDLIHLLGPLTEDAVMKTLQARFIEKKYFVRGVRTELRRIFFNFKISRQTLVQFSCLSIRIMILEIL